MADWLGVDMADATCRFDGREPHTHLNVFTPAPAMNEPPSPELASIYASWPGRFRAKVRFSDGCWEWTAYRDKNGYGRYNLGHRIGVEWAHRAALEFSGVELVPGLEVDHLCRNRECVRPDHLDQVGGVENVRRGAQANRAAGLCRRGLHEWVDENIYESASGVRRCRPCRLASEHERLGRGIHNAAKTHCMHGHRFDEVNTRWKKDGSRDCRACARERYQRRRNAA